ncbi:MAG: trehalose-phosphatase [Chloroflexota bacterium]
MIVRENNRDSWISDILSESARLESLEQKMQYLFGAWPEVSLRIRTAGHVLLLSDYDGTLAPIVERPELADLASHTRARLAALVRLGRYTVGVISGRVLSDLRQRVGLAGVVYAGNHGLEVEGPGLSFVNPVAEQFRPVFRILHKVLEKALAPVKGVLVENKGLSLSIHYRLVRESQVSEVGRVFERVVGTARADGMLKTTSGKKVYEVRPPVSWDKGKAIEVLLRRSRRRFGKKGALALFLGDDLTDEDGFKVVNKHDGISVFVGEDASHSVAMYQLRSPAEVDRFLGLLLELERGEGE